MLLAVRSSPQLPPLVVEMHARRNSLHRGFQTPPLEVARGGSYVGKTKRFIASPVKCKSLQQITPSLHTFPSPLLSSLGNNSNLSIGVEETCHDIVASKKGNPPIMPAVMTPVGAVDLSSVLMRNRIILIGQPINNQVAQRVISQLVTLASVDENADILVYLNCPGGSTYSVLAIYDCMSWIKPKVGTVCFGIVASQAALLLAGGERGMRYAMPNARIMIHQPITGCGGHVEDVRRQVDEAVQSRHKIDRMYAAFASKPLELVQQYTERDRFLSSGEAMEFGLIDGILQTEY